MNNKKRGHLLIYPNGNIEEIVDERRPSLECFIDGTIAIWLPEDGDMWILKQEHSSNYFHEQGWEYFTNYDFSKLETQPTAEQKTVMLMLKG